MYQVCKHTTTGSILRQLKRHLATRCSFGLWTIPQNTSLPKYIIDISNLNMCKQIIYNTGKFVYTTESGDPLTWSFAIKKPNDPFTKYW